ncbi:unnamed protein product [Pipistrellus nathusii]|uniref:Uncharacterized protein n=1 Tax=Pipistrellus nathusii TaxID=59473 RepID=A0ABN9ZL07_PIPNA
MEVLALWALLAALVLQGRGAAPLGLSSRRGQTGGNLSCFRCFKAKSAAQCRPALCARTDRVCLAHTLTLRLSLARGARPRTAPPAGGRASGAAALCSLRRVQGVAHAEQALRPAVPQRQHGLRVAVGALAVAAGAQAVLQRELLQRGARPRPRGPALLLLLGLGLLAASP